MSNAKKLRKELAILRAIIPLRECWVTSEIIFANVPEQDNSVRNTHSIGCIMNRFAFKQHQPSQTNRKKYFIAGHVLEKELVKRLQCGMTLRRLAIWENSSRV